MKLSKKIIVIGSLMIIVALLVSFTKRPEDGKGGILTMEVTEILPSYLHITIVDENGKVEEKNDDHIKNSGGVELINWTLNDLSHKGYKLSFTTIAGGGYSSHYRRTYIFIKE